MTIQKDNPASASDQNTSSPSGANASIVTVEYLMERLKHEASARHALEKDLQAKSRELEVLSRSVDRRISDRVKKLQTESERVNAAATSDQLTGLDNRFAYSELLARVIDQAVKDPSERVALFAIDLDLFKNVNDDFGHEAGDVVLKEVADRLQTELRDYDCIARLGGDEFAVICHIGDRDGAIEAVSERIIKIIERKIAYREFKLGISCSVGVALCPDDARDVSGLERAADTALYAAKRGGRGRWKHFKDRMAIELSERRELAKDLRTAIQNNDIDVWLYPTIDLKTGQISGVESLARWEHPTRGFIKPEFFVELAEEHRMMDDLGLLVIDRACGYANQWLKRGLNFPVSVNISSKQMAQHDSVEDICRLFDKHQFDPYMFGMEVTENFLADYSETTSLNLFELSNMGVGFLLDDFGTGHSNLEHLSTLPLTAIKLDRTLVSCVDASEHSQRVLKMVLGLSKSMSLKAVAEGVETLATLNIVNDLGFDQAQGYYYTKPLNQTDFMRYLMRLA